MPWSLEQAYDAYPQIEEEFSAALDRSLDPRGPDLLYDLVARLGLAPGAVALDVGCGEGRQALTLHQRFGFRVTGIDPVPRHIEVARAAAGPDGPVFELGTAEDLPAGPGTADLVWCRDVLVHVRDLPRAYAEFRRVLRPGGHVLVEERQHSASRKLLHASRLQRNRASYVERYGQAAYDMMLGDCLWHVYAMIGKLERRVYLLSFDGPDL